MPIYNVVYSVGRGKASRSARLQIELPDDFDQQFNLIREAIREKEGGLAYVSIHGWAPVPTAFVAAPITKQEEKDYSWLETD